MVKNRLLWLFWLVALAGSSASGQTSYPMLMSLQPVAAQVGQTSEHTIKSRYSMFGAYQVLVTGTGVTGEIVHPETKDEDVESPPKLETLPVRFSIAPDALPGVRDFRIATPRGASTVGQLVIVREKIVKESGDNNAADRAQSVALPATICGSIEKNEDIDYFKFQAEQGQALSFHVRAQRLQDRIHDLQSHIDPILTLRSSNGSTLAVSDNHFYGDPFLHVEFPQTGEYYLEIRDVRYKGNRYWEYSIETTSQPFVTNVFPMGLAQGQSARVQLVGYKLSETSAFLNLTHGDPVGPQRKPLPAAAGNPAPLVVSDLPVFAEENQDNGTPATAQWLALPAGISGRISQPSDIDCFTFPAIQGERYSFEVIARRHQSGLDSHLRILNAEGKQLALNDDLTQGVRSAADSLIENWTAPEDGTYVIELRDLHLRGGDEFVYFIRATRSQPSFELFLDTDKTQLAAGTAGVVFARVVRKNGFEGEVQLHVDGLPEGVRATAGRILAGANADGCLVLESTADASPTVANITVRGTAACSLDNGEMLALAAVATPYQETYQPGGGRGLWPVTMHTVAVGRPSDILSVKLSEYDVRLKPGESKKIDVVIERASDFDKNVTLDVTYNHLNRIYGSSLPPGVSLDKQQSKTLLTGTTTSGHLTLTAKKDAPPVEKQLIPVMANVSLNFVMKATYAAQPLTISIEPADAK